jgi:quercetin dioxygenase-like cupin family protein
MGEAMSMANDGAVVVRAGEGEAVHWGPAGVIRILAGADSTDGCFSLVEAIEEAGSAAPLHVHHGEAEAFYIVDGEIELTCGKQVLVARAGDFVYAPKDVPHRYAVVGGRPARVLLLFSRPGFERFFAEAGTPLGQQPVGPPDAARMTQLLGRYQMELLETWGA